VRLSRWSSHGRSPVLAGLSSVLPGRDRVVLCVPQRAASDSLWTPDTVPVVTFHRRHRDAGDRHIQVASSEAYSLARRKDLHGSCYGINLDGGAVGDLVERTLGSDYRCKAELSRHHGGV
jgi:hypothetical protein